MPSASDADIRQLRLSKNQILLREVNERVETLTEGATGSRSIGFVCECSNLGCGSHLELTREEYERIRAVGSRFAIAPGHEITEIEVVVYGNARFSAVDKIDAGGVLADATDPRRS